MARTDITLTVGARMTEADRIAREFSREMEQASGQAGDRAGAAFGSKLAQSIADQEPRIARSIEKTVTTVTRVNELTARHAKNQEQVLSVTNELADVNERINRLKESGSATDREINDLIANRVELQTALNRLEQASITLSAQKVRANRDHTAALRQVLKAEDDTMNEGGVGQSLLSIGKMISALRAVAIPLVGTGVAAIGAQAIQIASAATQSLWMIPAAAGAATAGIGTLTLATVGFGDAMKDIGDPEKFAEALQNLSPNAQQAALAIQAIMEPLTDLKNATQDALFAGASEMITGLTNQYLPTIEQLTTGIASAFNQAGRGIFDMLMAPETQSVIQEMFNNLVTAFEKLAPAAAPFSKAILDIVNAGSSFLPQIADAATRAANAFSGFIARASASGDLERWMREGLDTINALWQGVTDLAKSFADLAPAGREHLPEIISAIQTIAGILPATIELVAGLATPFLTVLDAAKQMYDFVKPAFQTIGTEAEASGKKMEGLAFIIETVRKSLANLIELLKGGPILGLFNIGKNLFNSFQPQTKTYTNINDIPAGANVILGGGGGFDAAAQPPPVTVLPATPGGLGSTGGAGTAQPGAPTMEDLFNGSAGMGLPQGGGIGSGGSSLPTAGIAPPPPGGYPVPAPPPEKTGGSGASAAKEPPFTADPSLYSVDAIPVLPVDQLPTGLASPSGLEPNAVNLNNIISSLFPGMPAAGGWRPPDGFNEHSSGQAVDFMVGQNMALGDEINSFILQNAKALGVQYTIWRAMTQYPDGRMVPNVVPGGDPTKNHFDHVHARVLPGDAKAGGLAATGMIGGGGYFAVDQEEVLRKQIALDNAKDDVEEKRLRLLELQSKGNATQRELMQAENNVRQAEDRYRLAALDLAKAREGKFNELDSAVTGAAGRVANSMGQVGAALADDFGLSEGLPGVAKWLTTFLANLAFAPAIGQMSAMSAMSPIQGGHGMFGMMGAQNIAAGRSPLGLSMGGAMMPGMTTGLGFTPTGMVPGAPMQPTIGPAPLGGGVGMPLTPGIAPHGLGGMPGPAPGPGGPATPQVSRPPSPGTGGGFNGLGDTPMAAISTAISAGSMALDAFAPGAGAIAGQVAQTGIQAANRTAAYLGQVGGIAASGIMETFLPNSSEAGDPSKSWLGRIASGISGARPALPNNAGSPAPAQQPQQGQGGGGNTGPMVNIESMVNQTPDSGQSVANQIGRMQMSAYAAGGPR